MWIYDTNILNLCDKKQLMEAMNKYSFCKTNEMGIMNIMFHFKYHLWERLPMKASNGKILFDWCELNNAEVVHDAGYLFRIRARNKSLGCNAIERGATSAMCKGCTFVKCKMCDLPEKKYTDVVSRGICNPLKKQLEQYDLIRNKHIPIEFLMNDRTVRLQVLAGLIDTDGYVGNNGKRIMISQSKWNIGRQIEFLAKSLGFIHPVTGEEKHFDSELPDDMKAVLLKWGNYFKNKIEELKNNAIIDLAKGSKINLPISELQCDEELKSDKIIPCKRSPDEQISNETLRVS
jgi:hypothetical protein